MGGCGSVPKEVVEAQERDAALAKQNYEDYMLRQQKIKLLLLGAWRVYSRFWPAQ